MRKLVSMKACANKKKKKNELLKMNESIEKLGKEKKNCDHIELVKRLTADGDDLVLLDKVNS